MNNQLEKLNKLIELMQNDTVKPADIERFLTMMVGVIKEAKDQFDNISEERLHSLNSALDNFTQDHSQVLEIIESKNKKLSEDFANQVKQLSSMMEKVMSIMPTDGKDGKDADQEAIIEGVLSRIPSPDLTPINDRLIELDESIKSITVDRPLDSLATKEELDYAIRTLQHQTSTLLNRVASSSSSGGSGTTNHAALSNLDYASAGHTGFEPAKGADDNYVTDAQLVVIGNTSGTNTGDQTISDATISTSDITTNNVSTSKHGFTPKAPNDATKFLDGTGAWTVPAGSGSVTEVSSANGNATVATGTTTPVITIVSAPKLETARTIGGTSFDGTANITPALATTVTTNANLTGVVTSVGNATAIADTALSIAKTSGLQTALDAKAPTASPTFTGTVTVPTPSNDTDASTKAYVDAVAQGLSVKGSVILATAEALPVNTYLSGVITITATGTLTVDGTVTALNDRILVKDEVAALGNGIYKVTTAGAVGVAAVLTRSTDMDLAAEFPGAFVFVEIGTVNTAAGFVCTNSAPPTVGTTAINFTQFSGAGQITAGAGMTKSGNTLNVIGTANRITVGADAVDIGTDVVTLTGTQTLTNKTLTSPKINEDVAITATATELNYTDGVTSAIQTQLDAKEVILTFGDGLTRTANDVDVDAAQPTITTAVNLPWTGLKPGTDGEVPTFDSSGNPAFVAVGTAGHVLTSNGTGAAPTFQAGAGGATVTEIQTATVSLSSANITGMFATPVQILAAPGAGKVIVVDSAIFSFTYNSVQYTGGGEVRIQGNGTTTKLLTTSWASAAQVNGAVSIIRHAFAETAAGSTTLVSNTAVNITNATAAFADGNSTAKVFITYRIITL